MLPIPTTRSELEFKKKSTEKESVHRSNCMTSQFNTIKLTEKSRLNACPHCRKTFVKPSGLKAHIYSHTGEKPHECPNVDCGRRFSLLSNLRRHIKTHEKADSKSRSLPRRRSSSKIVPLLPADLSTPCAENHADGGPQSSQKTMHNQYDPFFLQMVSLPETLITKSAVGLTSDRSDDTYASNNQPFHVPSPLFVYLSPFENSCTVQTPASSPSHLLPYFQSQSGYYAYSLQDGLNCLDYFDYRQQPYQQPQFQQVQQQSHQFVYPHAFYLDVNLQNMIPK